MTEQEWLASDDPQAMLHGMPTKISDHKLFKVTEARYWAMSCFPPQKHADLLRDIIGNPWRPVTLPVGPPVVCPHCGPYRHDPEGFGPGWLPCRSPASGRHEGGWQICQVCNGANRTGLEPGYCHGPCPWRIPLVMDLVRSAYEHRPGRECEECQGHGGRWDPEVIDQWYSCDTCHGQGRIEDGLLDRDRLLILADALEEAGCDNAEILGHLRRPLHCPGCGGSGTIKQPEAYTFGYRNYREDDRALENIIEEMMSPSATQMWAPLVETPCPLCKLIDHGPHVRGCWVLDLLLGRE